MRILSTLKSTAYWLIDGAHGFAGVPRVINGEKIRFPARLSRFYPTQYDVPKTAFIRAHIRAGNTVLDLGAHIGLFTVLLGRATGGTGHVISFEPMRDNREMLKRVIKMNGLEQIVSVRSAAVGAREELAEFFPDPVRWSIGSSLIHNARSTSPICINITTLDTIAANLSNAISFIKIDIEGAELAALEGAQHVLAHHRPAMCIEVHPNLLTLSGRHPSELKDLLTKAGYKLWCNGQLADERLFDMRDVFEIQVEPE
jgi:FkbM family methyltransferase